MTYPITRLRRLRRTGVLRRMVRETRLSPDDFIYPLFVCPGTDVAREVGSMPNVYQHSVDRVVDVCQEVFAEGEGENLVGRKGHVTQPEGVEEAVVDAALSALADDREARKHEGVEIAIDRAAHAAEFFGQIGIRVPKSRAIWMAALPTPDALSRQLDAQLESVIRTEQRAVAAANTVRAADACGNEGP